MKLYLILLCCGLSLGGFCQQKVASVQKLRQDTAALGRRVVTLRQQATNAQSELMHQETLLSDTRNRRDTLHDSAPAVYKSHLDSLNRECLIRKSRMAEAQYTFDSLLVQLDSTLGVYNTAVQRLQTAAQRRK